MNSEEMSGVGPPLDMLAMQVLGMPRWPRGRSAPEKRETMLKEIHLT